MSTYEISKSSLLSLKAEILRKQEDVSRAKIENEGKIRTLKKKYTIKKNKGIETREINDLSEEDHDLLRLSKSRLEAKSKLYDKLSRASSTNAENDRLYLVRFGDKNRTSYCLDSEALSDAPDDLPPPEEEDTYSDFEDDNVNPEDDWVEYTDSLGRSRKCLRRDLAEFKSRDADLRGIAEKRQQIAPSVVDENRHGLETARNDERADKDVSQTDDIDQESEMISGDMRRHMLRQQWEKEEEELKNKTDIHYQNVLFNEARQHGVGYFAFSKDEEERAQQQASLNKLRVETEKEQKRASELKAMREQQLAARMKAARNRRRARLGLPPEEDDVSATSTPNPEATIPPEDDGKQAKEDEEERRRAAARKRHVRPWDIGKDGVRPEFYEMTQHEWNEKKRKERPTEFAPPKAYSAREFSSMKSLDCEVNHSSKSLKFSTMDENRRLLNLNPYKRTNVQENELEESSKPQEISDDDDDDDDSGSNDRLLGDYTQSRAGVYTPEYPTRDAEENNSRKMEPVPIVNELETDDYKKAVPKKDRSMKGVEIPPPLTFEHFGPSVRIPSGHSSGTVNISASIEAGLKFLRKQTEGPRRNDHV